VSDTSRGATSVAGVPSLADRLQAHSLTITLGRPANRDGLYLRPCQETPVVRVPQPI